MDIIGFLLFLSKFLLLGVQNVLHVNLELQSCNVDISFRTFKWNTDDFKKQMEFSLTGENISFLSFFLSFFCRMMIIKTVAGSCSLSSLSLSLSVSLHRGAAAFSFSFGFSRKVRFVEKGSPRIQATTLTQDTRSFLRDNEEGSDKLKIIFSHLPSFSKLLFRRKLWITSTRD